MTIERFKYHEKFCVKSTFLDTSIDVEGTLDPGETLQDAVKQAREEMMKALPVNRDLFTDKKTVYDAPRLDAKVNDEYAVHGQIPVISKDKERIEIEIDNVEDIESLKFIKQKYPLMPASCLTQYNKKMDDLISGRPQKFSDGLE